MIGILLVVGVIGLITFLFYNSSMKCARYYEERNLKYVGLLTGVRSLFDLLFRRVDIMQLSKQLYDRFPDEG